MFLNSTKKKRPENEFNSIYLCKIISCIVGPLRPGDSLRQSLGWLVVICSVLSNELPFSFSLPINSQLESTAHEPS